jgi:hypothetical protein
MGFSRLPKEGDTRQVNMKAMCHGKSSPVRGSVTPLPALIYRGLLPTNLQLTRASKTAIPLRDTMAYHNFVGLAEFLRLARSLDSLEIHYYKLDTARFSFRRPTFSTWTPIRIGSLVFEASEIEAV